MKKITKLINLNECPRCHNTDEIYLITPNEMDGHAIGQSGKNLDDPDQTPNPLFWAGDITAYRLCKKCETSFTVEIKYRYSPEMCTKEYDDKCNFGMWG